ncbi:MAG: ribbon-helix-helix domain-containing protein [Spirulina sp. SIO3F2]|nr:ribbon-helix-helix domain-containing protein [Spirulina sp. SIO3F2]
MTVKKRGRPKTEPDKINATIRLEKTQWESIAELAKKFDLTRTQFISKLATGELKVSHQFPTRAEALGEY